MKIVVLVKDVPDTYGDRKLDLETGLADRAASERVLDEISFSAPDRSGEAIVIDAAFVERHIGDLADNADLSRFIL